MTPDEHAAEAERILAGFRERVGADHNNLSVARIHALLATRPTPHAECTAEIERLVDVASKAMQERREALAAATAPPSSYQRATTAAGYAIWQHQLTDDGEPCMQVKSSRYFPSNRLSANGEVPPLRCPCQGQDKTDPGTWLPLYVPATAPTTETPPSADEDDDLLPRNPDRVRIEWETDGHTHVTELVDITNYRLSSSNGVRDIPNPGPWRTVELDGSARITLDVSGTRTPTEPS